MVKLPCVLCNAEGRRFSFCIGILSTSLGLKMSSLCEMVAMAIVEFSNGFTGCTGKSVTLCQFPNVKENNC